MRIFRWDPRKAKENLADHGVSFEDAKLVFEDENAQSEIDGRFDYSEERWITIGMVRRTGVVLCVAHTLETNGYEIIQIIHAHKANKREEKTYGPRHTL